MSRTELKDSAGLSVTVNEGSSCIATITLVDIATGALAKTSLDTLVATLINASNGVTINSRDAQDILDVNGGTVSAAGVLTLKLQAADNPIVGSNTTDDEVHDLILTWGWTDGDAVAMTNTDVFYFAVSPVTDAVAVAPSTVVGWPG